MVKKVFIEIYVENLELQINFFHDVLSFELIRNEGDFAELRYGDSIFLLNTDAAADVPEHFFHQKINSVSNGIGVEIGIMVEDVKEIYSKALKSPHVKHITKIKDQTWGMTDFRVVMADNYYLRITSPYKN